MITRQGFLKRMALAAAACAFIDVPWPKENTPKVIFATEELTVESLERAIAAFKEFQRFQPRRELRTADGRLMGWL